jgi:hypothetical protein
VTSDPCDRLPFLQHDWNLRWSTDRARPYMARVAVQTWFSLSVSLLNRSVRVRVPGSGSVASIRQMGPGLVVETIRTPFGRVLVVEAITPVAPLLQRAVHSVIADRTVPRPVAKLALTSFAAQFERDVVVWNHKRWYARPLLVKGDGPIAPYRRWYRQFYAETSADAEAAADGAADGEVALEFSRRNRAGGPPEDSAAVKRRAAGSVAISS